MHDHGVYGGLQLTAIHFLQSQGAEMLPETNSRYKHVYVYEGEQQMYGLEKRILLEYGEPGDRQSTHTLLYRDALEKKTVGTAPCLRLHWGIIVSALEYCYDTPHVVSKHYLLEIKVVYSCTVFGLVVLNTEYLSERYV